MNSPRNGRTKRASSTLPLLFERQILTLDPKVEYLIVLSIFRSLLFVNVRVRICTDTTPYFRYFSASKRSCVFRTQYQRRICTVQFALTAVKFISLPAVLYCRFPVQCESCAMRRTISLVISVYFPPWLQYELIECFFTHRRSSYHLVLEFCRSFA